MVSYCEQFDAAIKDITERRGSVYGHPADDFRRAAALKAVVAECQDELIRHVLEMICVKLARLISSPDHADSWIDCAGYARTAMMVHDRRKEPIVNIPSRLHEDDMRGAVIAADQAKNEFRDFPIGDNK